MAALVVPILDCAGVEVTRCRASSSPGGCRRVELIVRGNRISSHDVPTYPESTPNSERRGADACGFSSGLHRIMRK